MKRAAGFVLWIAVGLLAGVLLAFIAIRVLTTTDFGQQRVRAFALRWLTSQVTGGEVRIGRITGRSLLGGATIHQFEIHDARGRPFVILDSASLSYDVRSLLQGRIILDDVVAWSPEIYVEQLPGDTLWNYQRIFADTTPADTTDAPRLIQIQQGRIVDGFAVIRRAWEPDDGRPVEPRDTARLILEPMPGGLAEVWRFENVNGRLDEVIWESPDEDGKLFRVETISGRGYVYEDPFELRAARGTLTQIDSVIAFDFPDVRLPTSRASVVGQVVLAEGENRYDVQIETPEVHFADVQWIYPELPEQGTGRMRLRIQTQRPKGILFLAENATVTAPGTQVTGTVGVVFGDTLFFTQVDLRASPLDVEFLESLFPGELPVEGLLMGTVEVKGPLSALETRGDLRYSDEAGAGSAVRWSGVLDARAGGRGIAARRFTAEVSRLDLDLLSALRPDFPLGGVVQGSVQASGRLDRALRLDGHLRHQAEGRPASELAGGGTVSFGTGGAVVDLDFEATPLALEEIATLSSSLAGLRGEARGRVRLTGPADRLALSVDLATPAGGVTFESLVARAGAVPTFAATGTLSAFQLSALSSRLPGGVVSGRFGFDLRGRGLAQLSGPVRLDIDSARVRALPIESGTFRAALGDGLLRVDTLVAVAPGLRLTGAGTFGLVEGRTGGIDLELSSTSLEPLEAVVFGEVRDPTTPRLGGMARVRGTISGTLARFDLGAEGTLESLHFDGSMIQSASLRLEGSRGGDGLRLTLRGDADSLLLLGRAFDSVSASLTHDAGETRVATEGWSAAGRAWAAAGSARPDSGATVLRLSEFTLGTGAAAWALAGPVAARRDPLGLRIDDFVLRRADGAGTLRAGGTLAWTEDPAGGLLTRPLDFVVDVNDVAFADALALLRTQVDAGGLINGSVRITGLARAPEIHGEMRIEDLRYENARLDQVGARLDYADDLVTARLDGFHLGRRVVFADGSIPLDLRFTPTVDRRLDRPIELMVRADTVPAGLPLALFDGFSDVEGWIIGVVTAKGTTREPRFGGDLVVRRGAATYGATGVRYQNVLGTMHVQPDRVLVLDLSARAADPREASDAAVGGVRLTGTLDLATAYDPGFDLTLDMDRFLAARRRDVEMNVSGRAHIGGRYHRPVISGDMRVNGGTLHLDEIYRQYFIVGLEDAFQVVDTSLVSVRRVLPPTQNPFLKNLRVENATVSVGQGSWLRSREMNVEVAGDLAIAFDRAQEDLRLTGELNVVRGTYRFDYKPFARIFEVRGGTVEFPGTPGIDPNLDITAAYRARTQNEPLDILARLSGTLQSPRVRLSSDVQPPISESDLASYLFFGAPTYAFNIGSVATPGGDETDDDGGVGRSALVQAAFNAYGFGYLASGLQTIAQNFGLVDYVGLTAAETAAPSADQGFGGLLASTELELGRYLSPRTYIAWTAPLRTPGRTAGFRLEWRFHPTFTAEFFAEDRFARLPTFGTTTSIEPRKVYGFFLFREWGY